jgi:ADP-ribose pyrophosphatase YjhB (NUDIX family)
VDNDSSTNNATSSSKDLLLEDYRYLADSFWKNEQSGETRVNWFIGIVTGMVGVLGALITAEHGPRGEPLRLIAMGALFALLVFGVITLLRLLTRNESTDRYKRGLDSIRQAFKDYFDKNGALVHYYPVEVPTANCKKKVWREKVAKKLAQIQIRKFGGLAHIVAAINCLIFGALVGAAIYPNPDPKATSIFQQGASLNLAYRGALAAAVIGFITQFLYITFREAGAKTKLRASDPTHAFGIVYREINNVVKYLLVRPKDNSVEWVLPKGHIEKGEGHGEAALREVKEESGVVARLVCFVVGDIKYKHKNERVNAKFYLMEYLYEVQSEAEPQEQEKKREKRWLSFSEALNELQHEESKFALIQAEAKRIKQA